MEIALGVIGVIFLLSIIVMYNGLISKKNQVSNVYASVDALLKKRHDLIPNLVSAVQVYMEHEKSVLTEVTELRGKALQGTLTEAEKANVEGKLSQALGKVIVAAENYPELKANQNFLQLQAALNEVEEQISAARRAFNASVTAYNNALEMFPTNIMASMMHLQKSELFTATEQERENVSVKDLFGKN